MTWKIEQHMVKFGLGSITFVAGLLAAYISLFRWVDRTGVQHLFGDYSRYILGFGAFGCVIFGAMLVNDAWVLKNNSKGKYGSRNQRVVGKHEKMPSSSGKKAERKQRIATFSLIICLFLLYPTIVLSLVSYITAANIAVGLFFDDFDEHTPPEAPDRWIVSAGTWQTATDGTTVYEQSQKNVDRTVSTAGNTSWADYTFQLKVKLAFPPGTPPNTGAILFFRFQDTSNYYFLFMKEDTDELLLYRRIGGVEEQIGSSVSVTLVAEQWYDVRIDVEGQIINVWVDDIQCFTNQDGGGTLTTGAVGVGTRRYKCHFDDVEVSPISS